MHFNIHQFLNILYLTLRSTNFLQIIFKKTLPTSRKPEADVSVGIPTRLLARISRDRGSISRQGMRFLFSIWPDRLWDPQSPLNNMYQALFPQEYSSGSANATTRM
jgi:hypothetical protein